MAIAPNTDIILLKGVPLDNGYKHTIYFANTTAQYNHFNTSNYAQKRFVRNTYQRVNKNQLKLQVVADEINDYNYMMFRNTNYGNKWFYAFINDRDYVNDVTTQITYEIDDIQTYFVGSSLPQCFVEREHSLTDNIGDNILPEPVELGEYVNSDWAIAKRMTDYAYLVQVVDEDSGQAGTNIYDQVFSGCELYCFYQNEASALKDFLDSYIQRPDQIVSIYCCPKAILPTLPQGVHKLPAQAVAYSENITLASLSQMSNDFQGYIPKNKKLYTYPYNYLNLFTGNQSIALRFEFFKNLTGAVKLTATLNNPVKTIMRPINYKGFPEADNLQPAQEVLTETLSIEGYPLCSWNVDTYRCWVAQNSIPIALKSVTSLGTSIATGGVTAIGSVNQLANVITSRYEASIKADQVRGSVNNSNVDFSNNRMNYYYTRQHLTSNYAKMIDDFFSVYGYACNQIKTPNISARPHWNYIKTHDIKLKVNGPSESINHIESIFNSGITFWKYASEVGDYHYDNRPI